MPLFVIPPSPPALIQPFKPGAVVRPSYLMADSSLPTVKDSPKTIPTVVEFYYSEPSQVPSPALPQTNSHAEQLGKPISVNEPSPIPDAFPIEQSSNGTATFFSAASSQVILELQTPKRDRKAAQSDRGNIPQQNRLITQEREGEVKEFIINTDESKPEQPVETEPTSSTESNTPDSSNFPSTSTNPKPKEPPGVLELIADQQEYSTDNQVITATGKVVMRFANGVLLADRLQINLPDRFAVAEGNVSLKRGEQLLQGERFEYYFVQDKGVIHNANGEIYQPTTGRDISPTLPTDPGGNVIPSQTLNERLINNQPLQRITTGDGYSFSAGTSLDLNRFGTAGSNNVNGGQINRLRFQAKKVDFDSEGWNASKVRITNDPFSPPELEIQAETAQYYNVAPLVDEVRLSESRVVLDQEHTMPLFQDRLVLDRRNRQPGILSFGYDGEDRGGLYVQSSFNILDTKSVRFDIKPQYLLQKALFPTAFPTANLSDSQVCVICPASFGLISDLDVTFSDRTRLINTFNFSSLDLGEIDTSLRAKVALQNKIGDMSSPHDLRFEYNYRERLFNGSLGFQTVNSSIGAILVSPVIPLGDPSLSLSYQASIQDIQSETDQEELLPPVRDNNLVTLMRYQGAVSLNKYYFLWMGEALEPKPDKGLRYTSTPVLPYLQVTTGVTGVTSFYSDGSSQPSVTGSIGLLGQFGHFSEPYLDYTGFNISYLQAIRGGVSPFYFDRFADTQVLSWGLTQQVYGPFRIGVQSAYSIDANKQISTELFIEYSRRTYNFMVRYNPQLQIGSINLRISDFNWSGNPGTFEGTDIRPVIQGVTR